MNKWIKVKSEKDFPKKDCFVAFMYCDPSDGENLGASVGHLSWSKDFSYGSVIDDGEVVSLNEIYSFCVIPSPIQTKGLYYG